MFSHVMVGSNDLDRSKQFSDAVLGTLALNVRPAISTTTSARLSSAGTVAPITGIVNERSAAPRVRRLL